MMYRLILLSILFMFLASPSFAGPLSDIGLFVADKDTSSIAWKAGVYGARPTISGVVSGSAAEQAGLKNGDIILSVGGKTVKNTVELRAMQQILLPVVVLRGMQRVTIGEEHGSTATAAATPQKNSEPPTAPILRIETGRHTAMVTHIDIDRSGRWLASASADKTVRIWDVKTGDLKRVIRPPIGGSNEGQLNAIAISPDSTLVACGGFTGTAQSGTSIYVFSREDGRMLVSRKKIPDVIFNLAFSPDGRLLVALLGSGATVIYSVDSFQNELGQLSTTMQAVAVDSNYSAPTYATHFSSDSRMLVTASYDGNIRLYDVFAIAKNQSFKNVAPIAKRQLSGGEHPRSVKFSPDGSKIAVGFKDTHNVNILSSKDLSLLYNPYAADISVGSLNSVAWSSDGQFLFAGGTYSRTFKGTHYSAIRRWKDGGRGSHVDIASGTDNPIMDLLTTPEGALGYCSFDASIGFINSVGRLQLNILPAHGDFSFNRLVNVTEISTDASIIYSTFSILNASPHSYNGDVKLAKEIYDFIFSIKETKITKSPAQNLKQRMTLKKADTSSLPVEIDSDGKAFLDKQLLNAEQYEKAHSIAVAYDMSSLVLGTDWHLRKYCSRGNIVWNVSASHPVEAVNISENGKYAVAAFGDGTIRWYNYATGKELLVLFLHADRKRWVLWTPEGFFDASPGAEDLIGWHLNRGRDKAAEFVSGSAMFKFFYRPDLVQAKFEGKDISAYLKDFDINTILNQKTLPPKVRFITRPAASDSHDITLRAEVCDNGGGVGDITLYLDNMPVVVDSIGRGLRAVSKGTEGCQQFEKTITLQNGSNSISLMAYNKNNTIESTRDSITITHREAITRKPTLHLLAIAVNSYRDGDLRLKYAIPDATALAAAVQKTTGGLFEKVQLHTIYDAEATKEGIAEQFAKIGATTRREDVFLLYVAGHGITNRIDGAYYFLPYDFRYTGEDALTKQGVSENDFKKYLAQIQATKSLLLLDTCNSGSFAEAVASRGMIEKTAVNKLVRAVGRATIVASSKDQVALEGYEGHGVFTWTLLEGMKGKAASSDGRITVNNLATFVEETLPKITYKKWGYEQIPQKSLMGMDFPIGMR